MSYFITHQTDPAMLGAKLVTPLGGGVSFPFESQNPQVEFASVSGSLSRYPSLSNKMTRSSHKKQFPSFDRFRFTFQNLFRFASLQTALPNAFAPFEPFPMGGDLSGVKEPVPKKTPKSPNNHRHLVKGFSFHCSDQISFNASRVAWAALGAPPAPSKVTLRQPWRSAAAPARSRHVLFSLSSPRAPRGARARAGDKGGDLKIHQTLIC